jgi:hypothetical protein
VALISEGSDVRLWAMGRAPGSREMGDASRGRLTPAAVLGAGIRGPLCTGDAVAWVPENNVTELGAFDCRGLVGPASLLAAIGSNLPDAWVRATLALCASALALPKMPFGAWDVVEG